MEDEQPTQQQQPEAPKKPGILNTLMLKFLMLIVFALMIGMCSIKYIS
ncbi:MAG: hypothetical protein L0Z73_08060 [Gammaproteobacteria bacterium]|nr:hypothetical protein [Gammaproteobacteria bacterium]